MKIEERVMYIAEDDMEFDSEMLCSIYEQVEEAKDVKSFNFLGRTVFCYKDDPDRETHYLSVLKSLNSLSLARIDSKSFIRKIQDVFLEKDKVLASISYDGYRIELLSCSEAVQILTEARWSN